MSAIPLAQLGEIAELQAGVGFPVHLQGRSSGDYPVAKVGDISRVGRSGEAVISAANHYIDEVDLARLKARPIPLGSVLFAKIGEAIRQNHRVIAGCALLVDNNAMAAIPTRRVESRYLYHFLRTVDFYGLASATTVPALRKSTLERLPVPLPPLAEQKRIARILDAADALRAKRREALAQLDTVLQSTFLDMFGDPVTNPMGWEEEHLANLVSKRKHSLKRGPFGGALKKEIFVAEGFKVYEQKNVIYNHFDVGSYFIQDSDYERLIAFRIQPNDLLISCSGTIGRIAAVPANAAPGVMNQALLKITLDESRMLNVFFSGLWRSEPFERQVLGMTHGTGMKNMKSMSELKSIKFPVPPLGFQHRFAAIVESVEQQKASQRAHLAELDTLFASLQSRAFRGDL